jgi:hypothetical protein
MRIYAEIDAHTNDYRPEEFIGSALDSIVEGISNCRVVLLADDLLL